MWAQYITQNICGYLNIGIYIQVSSAQENLTNPSTTSYPKY